MPGKEKHSFFPGQVAFKRHHKAGQFWLSMSNGRPGEEKKEMPRTKKMNLYRRQFCVKLVYIFLLSCPCFEGWRAQVSAVVILLCFALTLPSGNLQI